tara:strand:- start:709 stop:2106 length:1398 start_codon:yes stop_codon:yes gene_type:complete
MNKKNLSIEIEDYLLKSKNKLKINSNNIKKGDVFNALKGKKTHGNLFITQAIKNGAKYVITNSKKNIPTNIKKNLLYKKNSFNFLLSIANKKRSNFKGKVIGITGSVGKTTLKENLKFFLSSIFNTSASIKSYNNYLGVLLSVINIDIKSHFAVFEIGTNNYDEIKKLSSIILPHQTIITNIYPTHLENFKNTRNIAKEKSDIFNSKFNKNVKLAVFPNTNNDEIFLLKKAQKYKIKKIITLGDNRSSNYYISNIIEKNNEILKIEVKSSNKTYKFNIKKDHLNQINNLVICLILFIYNKIDIKIFYKKVLFTPKIDGRGLSKKIRMNNKKIQFIDESYNASPITMKNSINFLNNYKNIKNNRKILILGDMNELGTNSEEYHLNIVKDIVSSKIDIIILCGKLFKSVLDKYKIKKNNILYFKNEKLILDFLQMQIHNNDTILVKCSNSTKVNNLAKMLNLMSKVV